MTHWLTHGCFSLLLISGAALAEEAPLDDPAVVKKLLETPLPIVERDKLNPPAAVRFIAALTDANLYCDTAALRNAGYSTGNRPEDKTVLLSLKNLTLATAMDRLVKSIDKPAAPLKWDVENGVIVLSTAADKTWKTLRLSANDSDQDEAFKDDRVIENMSLDDVQLANAMKRLREEGINLYFNWSALVPLKIDTRARVNWTLKRVRPRTIVQLLVRDLSGPEGNVGFAVRDGVWAISTPADLAKQTHEWDWRPHHVKDQETANKLAAGAEDVGLDRVTFGDALETVSRMGELVFDVDWTDLGTAGIDRSTPITVNVRHVHVSTALELVLTEAGGADHLLDYTAEGGTVHITVKKEPATKPAAKPAKPAGNGAKSAKK